MDKRTRYRTIVKQHIEAMASHKPDVGEIDAIPILDDVHAQYQLLLLGWNAMGRVFTVAVHVRLLDEKVWIERDGTQEGFATLLLDSGIPHEDIVLAFHPPHKRPLTDFAVA